MLRRLATLAVTTVLAIGLGTAPASAYTAPPRTPPTFYSLPYTSELYTYSAEVGVSPVSFDNWLAWGAGRPVPVTTEFLHYTWAPDILAVSHFSATKSLWHHVTGAEWAHAGYPAPGTAGSLPGTFYVQYASSSDIIAMFGDTDARHHVTFAEWQAAGFPTPVQDPGGYLKLSWDASITSVGDVEHPGRTLPLTYQQWGALGFPTPRVRDTFPGDTWCWMPPEWMVNDQSPVPHYPEGGILYDGMTYQGYVRREVWPLIGVDLATATECG
ncbi:hypothetical protein [Cellulomonas sp. P5_C6]